MTAAQEPSTPRTSFRIEYDMPEQTTLVLRNDVSELESVMTFVSDLCVRNSIPAETERDLKLALDETITNVAQHVYPGNGEHHFTRQITVSEVLH